MRTKQTKLPAVCCGLAIQRASMSRYGASPWWKFTMIRCRGCFVPIVIKKHFKNYKYFSQEINSATCKPPRTCLRSAQKTNLITLMESNFLRESCCRCCGRTKPVIKLFSIQFRRNRTQSLFFHDSGASFEISLKYLYLSSCNIWGWINGWRREKRRDRDRWNQPINIIYWISWFLIALERFRVLCFA